jgi:bacterioferritin-associated ferredoxin
MGHGPWVSGASGLRGPGHLVAQAERTLGDYSAANDEGLVIMERPEPLVTALLLLGLAAAVQSRLYCWVAVRTRTLGDCWMPGKLRRATSRTEIAMYVCLCQGLKESDVERVGRSGCTTPEALVSALGLADPKCCGRCAREVDRLVRLAAAAAGHEGARERAS